MKPTWAPYSEIYRPVRRALLGGLLLAAVSALANALLLGLSGWFLAAMGLAGLTGLSLNYFTPAAVIRGLSILRTGGRYAERLVTHDAALRATAVFRTWFYQRLARMPVMVVQTLDSAVLFTRLRLDIDQLERFCLSGLLPLLSASIVIMTLVGIAAIYSLLFAVILLGFVVICVACVIIMQMYLRGLHGELAMDHDGLYSILTDILPAREILQVFGRMPQHVQDVTQRIAAIADKRRYLACWQSRTTAIIAALGSVSLVCTIGFVAPQLTGPDLVSARLATLPLICFAMIELLQIMPNAIQSCFQAATAINRLATTSDHSVPLPASLVALPYGDFRLDVRDISFSYNNRPVISHVTLSIHSGEHWLICGGSGTGKSTLIDLMTGFQSPQQGGIDLNGVPLCQIDQNTIQSVFSVVPQKPYIFADTFLFNLTLGCPLASHDTIMAACAVAGLSDCLAKWPDGLNTMLGEQGQRLSGGEIRRLAIARAILKPAACLIMDEPAEGLDADTETAVMNRVLQHASEKGQAVVMCVHHADRAPMQDAHKVQLGAE